MTGDTWRPETAVDFRENSVEFKDGFKKFLSQQPSMMEASGTAIYKYIYIYINELFLAQFVGYGNVTWCGA